MPIAQTSESKQRSRSVTATPTAALFVRSAPDTEVEIGLLQFGQHAFCFGSEITGEI